MAAIDVLFPEPIGTINPDLYGHFSEHIGGVIYGGIWVGEDSPVPNLGGFRAELVDYFRRIRPPVLRWPGGCFAETYDWRDGVGPVAARPVTANWWYNWDAKLESNRVGTHEFVRFCRLVGAKPYFAANGTSTTSLAIRDWIEYCNFPRGTTSLARQREENGDPEPFGVEYWGLGNENWGGGGNMTPETYCAAFRNYAMVASSVGRGCKFIACGPSDRDISWTRRFLDAYFAPGHSGSAANLHGLSMHYYCGTAGEATVFSEEQWYELLAKAAKMEELVVRHRAAMDAYDPERKIGLVIDEWGCWHRDGSGPSRGGNLFEQQSTMRDALVAATTLCILNRHCDKVAMANVAQLVNNLHSLFLTQDASLVATPNYHVFDMMKGHQGAASVRTVVHSGRVGEVEEVTASCSVQGGESLLTLVNARYADPVEAVVNLYGGVVAGPVSRTVLTARPDACNTFDAPNVACPSEDTFAAAGVRLALTLPAASVTCLRFGHK